MNPYDEERNRSAPAAPPAASQPPQPMVRVQMPEAAPYVTYVIIAITVVAYVLQMASEALLGTDILILYGARINEAILAGELWRFLTPALLHGSIPHILFNMYALFAFGTGLERHFGHGRFFLLYVLCAFTGNVISFLFSAGYSVGASTAVFGLLGAEAVFLFLNRKLFAGQFSRAIQNVLFIAAINLFLGLQPGIDNWGHVGGLIGGLMFTWFAGPMWEIEGISPMLRLVDQRPSREVIVGAATVMFIFGALAMWGLTRQEAWEVVINPWWAWLQIGLTVLGLLLGTIGNRFSMPILFSAGIICLGLMVMVLGWEAMITRQIYLRRSHGSRVRESYSGLAAFLKGIQFNLLGLFFVVLAIMMYTNIDGRGVFLQMVRRPGLPLVFIGGLILMQAVITLSGSNEMRRGSQGSVMVNLLISRLIPGIILLAVAAVAVVLGLFEIAAPDVFDERGGELLETLYGLR